MKSFHSFNLSLLFIFWPQGLMPCSPPCRPSPGSRPPYCRAPPLPAMLCRYAFCMSDRRPPAKTRTSARTQEAKPLFCIKVQHTESSHCPPKRMILSRGVAGIQRSYESIMTLSLCCREIPVIAPGWRATRLVPTSGKSLPCALYVDPLMVSLGFWPEPRPVIVSPESCCARSALLAAGKLPTESPDSSFYQLCDNNGLKRLSASQDSQACIVYQLSFVSVITLI